MKKQLLTLFLLIVSGCSLASENKECSRNLQGNPKYHQLVCSAASFKKEGDYDKAIELYLEASRAVVHEAFTFETYGALAELYRLNGNQEEYLLNKEIFELSLALYVGILSCGYDNNTILLKGSSENKIETTHAKRITDSMCFGETEHLLDRRSVGRLADEYHYFEIYGRIK